MNGTLTLVDLTNVSSEDSRALTVSKTDPGLDLIYRYDVDISVLLVIGYLSVFIVGLVGNSCVIWVVARTPRMRTVTNYLIVNLAFIDIVVLLVCVPSNLLSNLIQPWVLGVAMCKLTSFLQAVTVSASIQTLVIISVDRCVAICSTSLSQQIIAQYRVRSVITLIWTFSLLLMSPIAIYQDLVQATPDVPWHNCVDNYPTQKFRVVFNTVALFACCYVVPLVVITGTYILIFVTVWKRSIPGECLNKTYTAQYGGNRTMAQRSKLKVVKMMVCVVSTFFVSWAPLYLVHGYILFYGYPENNEQMAAFLQLVLPISQWLGMTNSCINPIFYAYFNQRFRHGFAVILGRRDRSQGFRDQRTRQHKWTMPNASHAAVPGDDDELINPDLVAIRIETSF
ncbi:neuropeptide SIFamide receptor-like [Varroa jacobsoni]|uniref:G-protein coupled receptors family 1 profile domain-containing protein n=1 Tax=Varroa destructor TaxID=109461 RepID=A0A7M7KNP7_VARDE|nr:neuropeptide SIFamide receptor-like [Varroa destructor]XP_022708258.1 neuropeptide SIFamide receptor-like [Varroa jacobsoni]